MSGAARVGGLAMRRAGVYNAHYPCSTETPESIQEYPMGKAKKPKRKPADARAAEKKRAGSEASRSTPRACAIWFPDKEARLRAIMILGEVGVPYVSVPGPNGEPLYGVTNKHIEALREEGIPFEIR
jgi:hypothetical protein